jgi:hypothetical protein
MINQSDLRRRQEVVERMHQPPQQVAPPAVATPPVYNPYANLTAAPAPAAEEPHLTYNPYPDSIHQSVVNPIGTQPQPQPQAQAPALAQVLPPTAPAAPLSQPEPSAIDNTETTTSEKPVSPDIISLANNSDLSIETIAHEANRIHQKEEQLPEEEVVISLR